MIIKFNFNGETKTCYRFESKVDDKDLQTLYLKKQHIDDAKIDPKKGLIVEIKEAAE